MSSLHREYLLRLEESAKDLKFSDFYLWPRTPIGDEIQEKIVQRIGVSDYELRNTTSRPVRIIRFMRTLIKQGLVPGDFSILDIACGDAIVLWQIKRAFPSASCYGLDCNKGKFPKHEMVQRDGVLLYRGFIQHLFRTQVEPPFDFAMMLNTYRGWESADLREHERDLPSLANAWFEANARYTMLTVTEAQLGSLRALGFNTFNLGRGEDDSKMFCFSKDALPMSWWHRLVSFR